LTIIYDTAFEIEQQSTRRLTAVQTEDSKPDGFICAADVISNGGLWGFLLRSKDAKSENSLAGFIISLGHV